MAVDNIAEKIIDSSESTKIVRIGHPARILESVLPRCLDALIANYNNRRGNRRGRTRVAQYSNTQNIGIPSEEIKSLVLKNAQIIFCTNVAAGGDVIINMLKDIDRTAFDLVIIDECAQATEPACWIPIQFAKKVVLAGDHMQLAPLIKSDEAAKKGLSDTMFEQLIRNHPELVKMLKIQHRMNEKIMSWSSECMYKGELVAAPNVADQLLED